MQSSYWDAVAIVGARQLLITAPRTSRPFVCEHRLSSISSNTRCACVSDSHLHSGLLRYKYEYIAHWTTESSLSTYTPDDIDEEYQVSPAVFLTNEDKYILQSSASSESGSSTSDSSLNSTIQEEYLEDCYTRVESFGEHAGQAGKPIVRLPVDNRVFPPAIRTNHVAQKNYQDPEIVTVGEDPDNVSDCQSSTTILRLPGMHSRLEITQITLVREVSVSPPKVFGGSVPHSLGSHPAYDAAPQAQERSRAVPHPQLSHASNTSCSYGHAVSCEHAKTVEPISPPHTLTNVWTSHFNPHSQHHTFITTHRSSNDLEHCPLSTELGRQTRRASDTFSMLSHSKPSMPSTLTCAERGSFTSPFPHHTTDAPAKSSTSFLAILNGRTPDTSASVTVIPRTAAESLALESLSAFDPPVARPKPIGTTGLTMTRRRQPETSIGVAPRCLAIDATPATHPGDEMELAPPWPPVFSPSASFS